MNSRERILATCNHQQPDRVPVDCGATPSSNISAIAYNNLRQHLGLQDGPPTKIYDVVQQQIQPDDWYLDKFGVDVIDIGRAFDTSENDWYDIEGHSCRTQYPSGFRPVLNEKGVWEAFSPSGELLATMPPKSTYFDQAVYPLEDDYPEDLSELPAAMDRVHWQAFAHSPWNHAAKPDFWEQLRAKALHLRDTTDKALMIVCGCNLFEWGTFLRRMDNFIMDLIEEPEEVERLLDALVEHHLKGLEKVCESVGDVVDIIRFGDDLGMDTGPFMNPKMYRELFKQRHTKIFGYAKKHSQAKIFLHSCGSIYRLIPDLIEAGVDILNPVQTESFEMDPSILKKEFGNDITFWGGGVNTRSILNQGTAEDVRQDVLNRMEIFSPGGGFVFNTVHNITPDVPPENIVAMYEAVREFNGN